MRKPMVGVGLVVMLIVVTAVGCNLNTVPVTHLGVWKGYYVSAEYINKLPNGNWSSYHQLNSGTVTLTLTSDWRFTGTLTDSQGRSASISGEVDRTWEECDVWGKQPPSGALWESVHGTLPMISHSADYKVIEAIGVVGSFWDGISSYNYRLAIKVVKQ